LLPFCAIIKFVKFYCSYLKSIHYNKMIMLSDTFVNLSVLENFESIIMNHYNGFEPL
jgi:hypothetical protein